MLWEIQYLAISAVVIPRVPPIRSTVSLMVKESDVLDTVLNL